MNSDNLLLRQQEITAEITEVQKQIDSLPDGKLICVQNGKYGKWFNSQKKGYSYIPTKDKEFAGQLAIKSYLACRIEDLKDEQNAIKSYLKHYDSQHLRTHELLSKPVYQNLLSKYFQPLSQELDEWCKMPYEHNTQNPENLIHESISGNILRSKSEAMIDMLLYQLKIPYRYECQLNLNGTILYPDFTIRHPYNGKLYYWEHFGMMDSPFYVQNYLKKMRTYLENGIIPDIDLITSFETKDRPLTSQKVQKLINNYFT